MEDYEKWKIWIYKYETYRASYWDRRCGDQDSRRPIFCARPLPRPWTRSSGDVSAAPSGSSGPCCLDGTSSLPRESARCLADTPTTGRRRARTCPPTAAALGRSTFPVSGNRFAIRTIFSTFRIFHFPIFELEISSIRNKILISNHLFIFSIVSRSSLNYQYLIDWYSRYNYRLLIHFLNHHCLFTIFEFSNLIRIFLLKFVLINFFIFNDLILIFDKSRKMIRTPSIIIRLLKETGESIDIFRFH